jgi:sterol desaturase/sphingolipid hydroxylase (fatty acid hydroxylase superfamily)
MESLLALFESMPDWQKLVWVVACLSIGWILEALIPLNLKPYAKLRHISVNGVFMLTTVLVNVAFGLLIVAAFNWTTANEFGLLYLTSLPLWIELIIAVVVFDLVAQYFAHYILHNNSFLFRFHSTHHSDTKVDATTSLRLHPGDILVREILSLGVMLVLGAPIAYYLIYRFVTIPFSIFTHSNIRLPSKVDRAISWVFVSPNMHKFHHHFERPWTDSNYGNILSIWDRLFGTLVYDDVNKIQYGLDRLDDSRDDDVMYQLKIPFDKNIKAID